MNTWLLSDLHLERAPDSFPMEPPVGTDVIVLAGDIGSWTQGIEWAKEVFADYPVVYVAGNHEYWDCDYDEALYDFRVAAAGSNVHFLERNSIVINGVRFLGTTLWTDYHDNHPGLMQNAMSFMNDHRCIYSKQWWEVPGNKRMALEFCEAEDLKDRYLETHNNFFHVCQVSEIHNESVAWLRAELAREFAGPTVVVSHHAPSYSSLRQGGVVM